jgi:hypothetical protein
MADNTNPIASSYEGYSDEQYEVVTVAGGDKMLEAKFAPTGGRRGERWYATEDHMWLPESQVEFVRGKPYSALVAKQKREGN